MYMLSFLGKASNMKNIDIKEVCEEIGEEKASALLGFHALTGSDFTSKFNGKLKVTCWKIFNESDSHVQSAFSKLGETDQLPSDETEKLLQRFDIS